MSGAAYTLRTAPQIGPKYNPKTDRYEYRQIVSFNGEKVKKTNIRQYEIFLRGLKTMVFICLIPLLILTIYNKVFKPHETINEVTIATKNGPVEGLITFFRDSAIGEGSGMVGYPVVVTGAHEKEIEVKENFPRNYMFVFVCIWGFILLEQYRMRRKRERYGLVSDKPWNQFEIEDC